MSDKGYGFNFAEYHSRVIVDHSKDGLRSGEGSVVRLSDGGFLILYSDFTGAADDSPGCIRSLRSGDNGQTWGEERVVFSCPANALNVMCASVLRLSDGRLGCVVDVKFALDEAIPHWSVSKDEGKIWSAPVPIVSEKGYYVVNNDRLIQLRDGTLVIPYALHRGIGVPAECKKWNPCWNARCGLLYSRDGGENWHRSPHWTTHTPEVFHPPANLDKTNTDPALAYLLKHRLGVFQEPGIVELPDGSLMMYIRSNYAIYRCFGDSVEAPLRDCGVIPGFNVSMGPATIRPFAGGSKLMMLYNDRGDIPFGSKTFQFRTPLSTAVSDDSGLTWTRSSELEDSSSNYCYFSLLVEEEKFYTSYYQSVKAVGPNGEPKRRNLASLKFGSGKFPAFPEAQC